MATLVVITDDIDKDIPKNLSIHIHLFFLFFFS